MNTLPTANNLSTAELNCLWFQQFILPFFTANIGQTVHQLLVIQALRPDRVRAMGHILVGTVLGEEFMHHAEQGLDLASVVEHEV